MCSWYSVSLAIGLRPAGPRGHLRHHQVRAGPGQAGRLQAPARPHQGPLLATCQFLPSTFPQNESLFIVLQNGVECREDRVNCSRFICQDGECVRVLDEAALGQPCDDPEGGKSDHGTPSRDILPDIPLEIFFFSYSASTVCASSTWATYSSFFFFC